MKLLKKISIGILILMSFIIFFFFVLYFVWNPKPEKIQYGASFSTLYSAELGLEWKEVYDAVLTDLEVKHLRVPAYWPQVEPQNDVYNFHELDYQLDEAHAHGTDVILAVGRRLPRWPECHIPEWAEEMEWEDQKEEIREYIRQVVERYKDHPALLYWQVENEPYLTVFAYEHCGDLDEEFLKEEIVLVESLDGGHDVLVTDSGNLGPWFGAYPRGDLFGTSVYIYFWNPELGQFETILPPMFYGLKGNVMRLLFGSKDILLIELGLEPWLTKSVVETPLELQYERMDMNKFNRIVEYAERTRLEKQSLWGVEWWYWMKKVHGKNEFWERGRELFDSSLK